jgi:hypothetical protein
MIQLLLFRITPALRVFILGAALLVVAVPAARSDFLTTNTAYTVPATSEYTIVPLLSAGDAVPETSDPTLRYRMVGIPDGLGAYENDDGNIVLHMNHELVKNSLSQPLVDGPTNRGALVSKWLLNRANGSVISGERAYDRVFSENTLIGPAAEVGNDTPGFSRFCSGNLAWHEAGFDRPIYFCGEETTGAGTFYGNGGTAVAIFDNELHTLPKLGKIPWENAVVRNDAGPWTVIMCLKDGPESPDSQLFMYVGRKDPTSATVLGRNGLDNGELYMFVAARKKFETEIVFQSGQIQGKWVRIPKAASLSDADLAAAASGLDGFGFIRIEDGAFRPGHPNEFYFVTTGGTPGNLLGRLYRLDLSAANVLGPAKLTVIYNADHIINAGGDIAISPDNVSVSDDYVMICEDGTGPSRPVMGVLGRQGNIWRFDLNNNYAVENIAEMTGLGWDGVQTSPGIWETSGIIDISGIVGAEAWLFDVQAHSPTKAPAPLTVEDGQLLLMIRNP